MALSDLTVCRFDGRLVECRGSFDCFESGNQLKFKLKSIEKMKNMKSEVKSEVKSRNGP